MQTFDHFNNTQVAKLPKHLRKYIVDQCYERYTPVDHAVWRYVMRQNYSYLKDVAYYPYIPGLKKAGLTIEKIPSLQEINDSLAEIGWGAVTVDGFIPPAAFMEYQAYKVLVIAADIRQLEHIEYTSAPDIIHESAGHAPIISDEKYNQYLSYLGTLGTRALFSSADYALYEAIRHLSILKEMPHADPTEIAEAEAKVLFQQQNLGTPSEMALLSRLQWWTVEYGLIGDLQNPKIYGAGLLSSIGESVSCMKPSVKKIEYTIDAINYSYDITQQQPQLFVTPTFQNLIDVLQTFESNMAFRKGGVESLQKAIECKNICTAVLSSGLQISGVFTELFQDQSGNLQYFRTAGGTALAVDDQQLPSHDTTYHSDGFGSPLGKLNDANKFLEDFTEKDLIQFSIRKNEPVSLEFEHGIRVEGIITQSLFSNGKLVLLSFRNCTVQDVNGNRYFEPHWGNYDMAVGQSIVSVFNGVADKSQIADQLYVSNQRTTQQPYTEEDLQYQSLIKKIRDIREKRLPEITLPEVWQQLSTQCKQDWLGAMEILELTDSSETYANIAREARSFLEQQKINYPTYTKLINDGLRIIDAKLSFQ
jgi:phenylalanine-4-hydroxylase